MPEASGPTRRDGGGEGKEVGISMEGEAGEGRRVHFVHEGDEAMEVIHVFR